VPMPIQVVFETHSTTLDNEAGRATGWLPGHLSATGQARARELRQRREHDGITAVFSSDLERAVQTASLAFGDSGLPVLYDGRLRECDYGQCNGADAAELRAARPEHLERPYPGGESWRQAVTRVGRFLTDLPLRWNDHRILVIGHVATRWGLEHHLNGVPLEELVTRGFSWQEGWEYRIG
jgi:2,3-bisphosphoglycerate-dependent phosphoglycerate mutase